MATKCVITVDLADVWARAHQVALWSEPQQDDVLFYVKEWNRSIPWVWWLALPATALVCSTRGRVGFFIACQFWVPFVLFSVFLPQKFPRYVAQLFPFLALIVAAAVWEAVRWPTGETWSRRPSMAAVTTYAALVLLVAAAVPAVSGSVALHDEGSTPRWRDAFAYLRSRVGYADAVLASVPLSTQYHLPERDAYVMNNFFLDPLLVGPGNDGPPGNELYSGLPLVDSVESLERVTSEHPTTWIASNWHHFYTTAATPWDMRRFIESRCRKHWAVADESVIVFACPGPAREPAQANVR